MSTLHFHFPCDAIKMYLNHSSHKFFSQQPKNKFEIFFSVTTNWITMHVLVKLAENIGFLERTFALIKRIFSLRNQRHTKRKQKIKKRKQRENNKGIVCVTEGGIQRKRKLKENEMKLPVNEGIEMDGF